MTMVRYGIIGFGGFAERVIMPAIRKCANSELTAIQKRSRETAAAKASQFGIPHSFDSPSALVASKEVDAVFIVSSNAQHHAETLTAARAGKHVLVEKPMSVTYAEAEAMVRVCREAKVKFMVGHMIRFSPVLRRLKEIIASGIIGPVSIARAEFMYDASFSERRWLRDRREAGGGPWYDIGIHCLDSMRFVLGESVRRITHVMHGESAERTEASSIVSLVFESGIIGSIVTSFETGYRHTAIEFLGSKGSVMAENFTPSNVIATVTTKTAERGDVVRTTEDKIAVPDLYTLEIAHFSDCILNGAEPSISNDSSLHNQWVLEQAMTMAHEK